MNKFLIMIMFVTLYQIEAQEFTQTDRVSLRLADCIAQAFDYNPSLKISQEKLRAAEARSSEAMTTLLPQLKLSGRVAELSDVPEFSLPIVMPGIPSPLFPSFKNNYSVKLSLQQPLFTGFKLRRSKEMADLNADATREDLEKDRADLILNVTTAYWNLYRATKIEEVLRYTVEQMSGHLKDVQNYAKQGMATDADVMKVQVQLSDIKVKFIEARNGIRLAMMALNSLIGNQLDMEVTVSDTPTAIQDETDSILDEKFEKLVDLARQRRPEVRSMQYRVDIGSAGVTAANGGWFPQLYLAANYDYARPNQRIIPPERSGGGPLPIRFPFVRRAGWRISTGNPLVALYCVPPVAGTA